MRAIVVEKYGGPEQLRPMSFPRPDPGEGEVLLRVVSAGVNPLDCRIRSGAMRDLLDCRLPMIPGWDVAGLVEEFGKGAAGRFRKGDRVWAFAGKAKVQWGSYAEYVTVPEPSVAKIPAKLLYEEAAAVPVAALAARQALFSRPGVGEGSTVLIHGAGGGVGHFAVQFAKNAGARVVGTASRTKQSFILGLGAEVGVDYTTEDFPEAVRRAVPDGVDLVIDLVGRKTLARSYELLKRGGRLVSLVEKPNEQAASERGAEAHMLLVEPSGEQLAVIGEMFDQKRLKTHVQKIYPLAKAAEAHRVLEEGHVQGKLVLNL